MNAAGLASERAMLDRLRESYEGRGYTFIAHPVAEMVPAFLEGYRPDALAVRGDEKLVIEVKVRGQPSQAQKLAHLTDLVSRQPGWKFLLVVGDASEGESLPELPSLDLVDRELRSVRDMVSAGHGRAAIISAWSAFEAVARWIAVSRGQESGRRPMSGLQVLEFLEMQGYLDPGWIGDLRRIMGVRNRAVHGDLTLEPEAADIEWLCAIVAVLEKAARGGEGQD